MENVRNHLAGDRQKSDCLRVFDDEVVCDRRSRAPIGITGLGGRDIDRSRSSEGQRIRASDEARAGGDTKTHRQPGGCLGSEEDGVPVSTVANRWEVGDGLRQKRLRAGELQREDVLIVAAGPGAGCEPDPNIGSAEQA